MSELGSLLLAIMERADKATPRPWEYFSSVNGKRFGVDVNSNAIISFDPNDVHIKERMKLKYSLEFVAHARTDVPRLVEALEKAIEILTWIGNLEPETKRPNEELAMMAISDAEVATECLSEIKATLKGDK